MPKEKIAGYLILRMPRPETIEAIASAKPFSGFPKENQYVS
jgi:hypothetical protein